MVDCAVTPVTQPTILMTHCHHHYTMNGRPKHVYYPVCQCATFTQTPGLGLVGPDFDDTLFLHAHCAACYLNRAIWAGRNNRDRVHFVTPGRTALNKSHGHVTHVGVVFSPRCVAGASGLLQSEQRYLKGRQG